MANNPAFDCKVVPVRAAQDDRVLFGVIGWMIALAKP